LCSGGAGDGFQPPQVRRPAPVPRLLDLARAARERQQRGFGVRAGALAVGARGVDSDEPVQVVTAVRAAVRPAAVQSAKHALLLLANKGSHPCVSLSSASRPARPMSPVQAPVRLELPFHPGALWPRSRILSAA